MPKIQELIINANLERGKMKFRLILVLALSVVITGCAIGTKIDYSSGHIEFDKFSLNDQGGCSIEVVDKRPYVLSGKKSPNFVGIRRGGYGNPFNVKTESGQPLADDLTKLFSASYAAVIGSPCGKSSVDPVRKEIVYTLNEWKTDVMVRGKFIYDVTTAVSIDDKLISSETESGTIVIDKNFQLPSAIVKAANQIHGNPKTAKALSE